MSAEAEVVREAAGAVEATGGLGALGINLKIFLAQLVNFLVVIFVLWKWAYHPIVKMLESRTEKIEKGMKAAQAAETRLAEFEAKKSAMLKEAKQEAARIQEEARAAAEEQKDRLIVRAKEQVSEVIAKGKEQLKAEKEAMIREAREDLVHLVIEGARKILEDGVDAKTSVSVAEKALAKMMK